MNGENPGRAFAPRTYDREVRSLTIDFTVHEPAPASQRTIDAQPGDTTKIGGPRGSAVVFATFDW